MACEDCEEDALEKERQDQVYVRQIALSMAVNSYNSDHTRVATTEMFTNRAEMFAMFINGVKG